MALGEYVSVSSQRDSETALLAQEKAELVETPEAELAELTALYAAKGLSAQTAAMVAAELTAHDALAAHIDAELNIDPDDLADPIQATIASALSFTLGALLPLLAILLAPAAWRVPTPFVAVLIALAITGVLSARLGGSNAGRAVIRVLIGGTAGLAFTYGIGHLVRCRHQLTKPEPSTQQTGAVAGRVTTAVPRRPGRGTTAHPDLTLLPPAARPALPCPSRTASAGAACVAGSSSRPGATKVSRRCSAQRRGFLAVRKEHLGAGSPAPKWAPSGW